MTRVVLLVLLVVAVLAWWASVRRRDGRAEAARRAADERAAQPMLACAHCGVHVPRSEAVLDAAERAFCSDAHRLQGTR